MNLEIIRKNGLKKIIYILKVLESCKTYKQVLNTITWGHEILKSHYLSNEKKYCVSDNIKVRTLYINALELFNDKIEISRKNKENGN